MQQIKQMINTVKMAQNPQAALNQIAINNPQMKQVIDIVNKYGGDPNKAFYGMAEQYGIDPNEILEFLK
jgi:hypothetical protein